MATHPLSPSETPPPTRGRNPQELRESHLSPLCPQLEQMHTCAQSFSPVLSFLHAYMNTHVDMQTWAQGNSWESF